MNDVHLLEGKKFALSCKLERIIHDETRICIWDKIGYKLPNIKIVQYKVYNNTEEQLKDIWGFFKRVFYTAHVNYTFENGKHH